MKHILLIGQMNKPMENLNDSLRGDFHVQICATEPESVKTMLKIVKPDMVIVCLVGEYEMERQVLEMLKDVKVIMPVLMVGKKQECDRYQEYYEHKLYQVMFRPIVKSELIAQCERMLHLTQEAEQEEQETGQVKVRERNHKTHIMVVDDSPMVLRNIKNILEPDYKVSVAGSGKQALKFVAERQPDLILLDYDMPMLDGRETFEQLKKDEFGKEIPVIFLTGVADRNHIYAVLQLEPAGYILKPPVRDKLIAAIEDALEKKREQSQQ